MSAQEIIAELARLSPHELSLIDERLKELQTAKKSKDPSVQPADSSALQTQPLTEEESDEAFSPDPEWEAITSSMARLPIRIPHEKQIGTRIKKTRLAVDILAERPKTSS